MADWLSKTLIACSPAGFLALLGVSPTRRARAQHLRQKYGAFAQPALFHIHRFSFKGSERTMRIVREGNHRYGHASCHLLVEQRRRRKSSYVGQPQRSNVGACRAVTCP